MHKLSFGVENAPVMVGILPEEIVELPKKIKIADGSLVYDFNAEGKVIHTQHRFVPTLWQDAQQKVFYKVAKASVNAYGKTTLTVLGIYDENTARLMGVTVTKVRFEANV
jgi:hypothetical protein